MKTLMKYGPRDHGREVMDDDVESAEYAPGYKYEIIDGRLYVSPLPNMPESRYECWLHKKLLLYSLKHPEVINHVVTKGRVVVRERPRTTIPEPDTVAYHDFPIESEPDEVAWTDVSPVLVAEILSGDDPDKDLARNPGLFLLVPGIKEYWVIDIRHNPRRPTMTVFRRRAGKWQIIEVGYQEVYTTRLLPGFKLILDYHQ